MEDGTRDTSKVSVVQQGGSAGLLWIAGWLFTIGLLQLSFWKGVLALLLWSYYLGVALVPMLQP